MADDRLSTHKLGTASLLGVEIQLKLKVDFFGNDFTLMVPLPAHYPPTAIGQSPKIQELGLCYAQISQLTDQPVWSGVFKRYRKSRHIPADYGFILDHFYINPKLYGLAATPAESALLKGLGKRALCLGLRDIVTYLQIPPDRTLLMLEADGGGVSLPSAELRYHDYIAMEPGQLLTLYRDRFPVDFERYRSVLLVSHTETAAMLVATENNAKLVEYYNRAFGLEPVGVIGLHTTMAASLAEVLPHCV